MELDGRVSKLRSQLRKRIGAQLVVGVVEPTPNPSKKGRGTSATEFQQRKKVFETQPSSFA